MKVPPGPFPVNKAVGEPIARLVAVKPLHVHLVAMIASNIRIVH